MLCTVLRSVRKADTYLYLPRDASFEDLPETLQHLFTPHTTITTLHVTPERRLARLSGAELITHLNDDGYYLQLPPQAENWLKEHISDQAPKPANEEK